MRLNRSARPIRPSLTYSRRLIVMLTRTAKSRPEPAFIAAFRDLLTYNDRQC